MKLNPRDVRKTSKEMFEKLQESDLRSRLSIACSRNWEIIIAAIAALIVGILLVSIR